MNSFAKRSNSSVQPYQQNGEGTYIDVSMFDANLAFMTSALTPFLVTGQPMAWMGNTGYSGLPTASLFVARDGREISLGVVQQNQFEALARIIGKDGWLSDERFSTPDARREHFDALKDELAAIFATKDAIDWERLLSEAGIPCGTVRRVDEAASMAGEDALISLNIFGPPEGQTTAAIPNVGFRMTPGGVPPAAEVPPHLDEHHAEILRWLGMSK